MESVSGLLENTIHITKDFSTSCVQTIRDAFTEHPAERRETYTQHLFMSFIQVLTTFIIFIGQLVHAIFPFLQSRRCVHNNNGSERMTDYEMVRKFTEASGTKCATKPTLITRERGEFLIRHALSELHEFALTITDSTEQAHQLMKDSLGVDPSEWKPRTEFELIEDQEDAICDTWVYMLNVAAEFGQDVSSMMKVVMKSNMAKIDPVTGKCIRRESDGKIMKPEGWTPPDTRGEIERQMSVDK